MRISFNPYFNGYSTLTKNMWCLFLMLLLGFNPYFNGYSTLTIFSETGIYPQIHLFQSLF